MDKWVERRGRERRILPTQDAYVSECIHGVLMERYCISCDHQSQRRAKADIEIDHWKSFL